MPIEFELFIPYRKAARSPKPLPMLAREWARERGAVTVASPHFDVRTMSVHLVCDFPAPITREDYNRCHTCGHSMPLLPYPGDASRFNAFDPDKDIDQSGATNNGERADRAQRALDAYIGDDRPDESHYRDLICDLMHLAHREGMDPVWQADLGIGQWRDESGND